MYVCCACLCGVIIAPTEEDIPGKLHVCTGMFALEFCNDLSSLREQGHGWAWLVTPM